MFRFRFRIRFRVKVKVRLWLCRVRVRFSRVRVRVRVRFSRFSRIRRVRVRISKDCNRKRYPVPESQPCVTHHRNLHGSPVQLPCNPVHPRQDTQPIQYRTVLHSPPYACPMAHTPHTYPCAQTPTLSLYPSPMHLSGTLFRIPLTLTVHPIGV